MKLVVYNSIIHLTVSIQNNQITWSCTFKCPTVLPVSSLLSAKLVAGCVFGSKSKVVALLNLISAVQM